MYLKNHAFANSQARDLWDVFSKVYVNSVCFCKKSRSFHELTSSNFVVLRFTAQEEAPL